MDVNNVEQKMSGDGIGRVKVSTVKLPDHIKIENGTYTYSGSVLIAYKTESDVNLTDYYNIAVLNDVGNDFRIIFSGILSKKEMAIGVRFMLFKYMKRLLLCIVI